MVRATEGLEYGIIGVNDVVPATAQAPFGGMKQSGTHREGGEYAFEFYTELKHIAVPLGLHPIPQFGKR